MIRKHNRRAAKAAFAIALGVAIVLGGARRRGAGRAAARRRRSSSARRTSPSSTSSASSTSRRSRRRASRSQYKENIGSTELIDTALTSGKITLYPEYTGIMLLGHLQAEDAAEDGGGDVRAREAAVRRKRGQTLLRQTPFQDRDVIAVLASDREEVRPEDASPT